MRVDGGVAGEGRVAGVPKFHSWGISAPCHFNKYQLRLDVQRFLWPVYYIIYITRVLYFLECDFPLCRKVQVRCEQVLIGASLSEPHSSDVNGDFL